MTETGKQGGGECLDALLAASVDHYRNTLLDRLDELWLDGRDKYGFEAHELNAINGAAHELQVVWALKYDWERKPRTAHPSPESPND